MASAAVPALQEGLECRPTVLLVDDSSLIPALCRDVASRVGLHVLTALTATDALGVIAREPVDIVITDITVPHIRGLEFIKCVHENYPRIRIIVLTQYGTIDAAVGAMNLGALDFITRPFDLTEFRLKLGSWTEDAKLERIGRTADERSGALASNWDLTGQSSKI